MTGFFGQQVLCIVTGASRGLGAEIVNQLSARVAEGSHFVLCGRDEKKLNEKCRSLKEKFPSHQFEKFVGNNATCTFEDYAKLLTNARARCVGIKCAVLVHNAGSLGSVDVHLKDLTDSALLDTFLQENVRSVILLSSAFLANCDSTVSKFIINISSACGLQPFSGLGLYCTSKAARDMYFKCLAKENPETKVLQYAPGPLETDMMAQLRTSPLSVVTEMAESCRSSGRLLSVQQTTEKLCEIIDRSQFTSGDHIDYFD